MRDGTLFPIPWLRARGAVSMPVRHEKTLLKEEEEEEEEDEEKK